MKKIISFLITLLFVFACHNKPNLNTPLETNKSPLIQISTNKTIQITAREIITVRPVIKRTIQYDVATLSKEKFAYFSNQILPREIEITNWGFETNTILVTNFSASVQMQSNTILLGMSTNRWIETNRPKIYLDGEEAYDFYASAVPLVVTNLKFAIVTNFSNFSRNVQETNSEIAEHKNIKTNESISKKWISNEGELSIVTQRMTVIEIVSNAREKIIQGFEEVKIWELRTNEGAKTGSQIELVSVKGEKNFISQHFKGILVFLIVILIFIITVISWRLLIVEDTGIELGNGYFIKKNRKGESLLIYEGEEEEVDRLNLSGISEIWFDGRTIASKRRIIMKSTSFKSTKGKTEDKAYPSTYFLVDTLLHRLEGPLNSEIFVQKVKKLKIWGAGLMAKDAPEFTSIKAILKKKGLLTLKS